MFCQLKYACKLIFMQPQKPTVLDVARLALEIQSFAGLEIEGAYSGYSKRQLSIKLRNSKMILGYSVDKSSAYMGALSGLPENAEKSLAGIEGHVITEVKQINYDRILEIELGKKDRLGKTTKARLIFELIPNMLE